MVLNPQCWPIMEKTFVFFCGGKYERIPKKSKKRASQLYYHNQDQDHSYSFFHVENDTRAFFITVGRSRLHHVDSFMVDEMGKFIRNGTSVYDYYTTIDCVYRKIRFLERLLKDCLVKENITQTNTSYSEMMVIHFPESKAPTYTESLGENPIYFNWLICLLGLFLLLCCLK
ncbi:uncharacterized protein [Drosophila takahashii]|uniref:uncharacterized protein n=1 Tax=Drosophila takahashii TaxID=29030 RepID=UPI001CF7F1B7|nr:uncharacterized protein LOC108064777 [Drosophila takahashii]